MTRFLRLGLVCAGLLFATVPAHAIIYCHNAYDGTVYVYDSGSGTGHWIPLQKLGAAGCDVSAGF